ncbi:MAG: type IV pilin [Euryarchaeota archaeon]|nr:type IV pilin [Euryarchaeota archaeon]
MGILGPCRAVSPIIATILLVAITVVLAAVLYVLVTNILGATPQTTEALGLVAQAPTQCATTGPGSESYAVFPVVLAKATGPLTTDNIGASVTPSTWSHPLTLGVASISSAGTCPAYPTSSNVWIGYVVASNGTPIATYDTSNARGWTALPHQTIPSVLVTGLTFCVVESTSGPSLTGATLTVFGVNGVTVTATATL